MCTNLLHELCMQKVSKGLHVSVKAAITGQSKNSENVQIYEPVILLGSFILQILGEGENTEVLLSVK